MVKFYMRVAKLIKWLFSHVIIDWTFDSCLLIVVGQIHACIISGVSGVLSTSLIMIICSPNVAGGGRGCGGLVVKASDSGEREVGGSSPTQVAVLCT